jgi:hypothetical protein
MLSFSEESVSADSSFNRFGREVNDMGKDDAEESKEEEEDEDEEEEEEGEE